MTTTNTIADDNGKAKGMMSVLLTVTTHSNNSNWFNLVVDEAYSVLCNHQ